MSGREKAWLLALLTAALAVRLAFCWIVRPYDPAGPVPDIDHYQVYAQSMLETGTLSRNGERSASREPGYVLFLAGLYAAAGARFSALWPAQALLDTLSVLLVFLLGRRVFSRNVAWLGAGMAAFYPQFVYYVARPGRETLLVFLLAAAVWTMLRACERPSLGRVAAAAALWALCPLTASALLPTGLAAAAGLWFLLRRRGGDARRWTALYLVLFLGLYALWPLRNYMVFGRLIPGVTGGGPHVYVQLIVPNAVSGTSEEKWYTDRDPVMRAADGLSEDEMDRHFYRGAAAWIGAHPLGFAKVMAASLVKMWRLYPYPRDYGLSYRRIVLVSLLSDAWMIPLGFAGLLLAGRRFQETDLFNLTLFSLTFTYMVYWAIIRYRLPLMPYVLIYAAYALERAAGKWRPGWLPYPTSQEEGPK